MPAPAPFVYRATVVDVHDGDTLQAVLQLGFDVNYKLTVRLLGIDTPELKGATKAAAIKSRDRLRELVLNKEVILRTVKDGQEKYGRYLAEVFVPGSETSVQQTLINEGLGYAYFGGKKPDSVPQN